MPLTTVAEGRVFDWSHAVGRNAARGPGFNYVQTMCLGKNHTLYATNRGNENNFGMHVNKVQLGDPGEEEHIADFCDFGEGDGKCTWPFGVAVDDNDHVYVSDDWQNTISVFDSSGNFLRKWGKTGSGDGELLRPAGLAVEKNGNIIVVDSGNNRLQVFTPGRQVRRQMRRTGQRRWSVQPALGDHPRQGRQYLRRRLEEPSHSEIVPRGQVPDEVRPIRRG